MEIGHVLLRLIWNNKIDDNLTGLTAGGVIFYVISRLRWPAASRWGRPAAKGRSAGHLLAENHV